MNDEEGFAVRLAAMLALEDVPTHSNATLFEEWSLDSLQAFQLIVAIEAMADVDVPPPYVPPIFTVRDAFDYFLHLRAQRENER